MLLVVAKNTIAIAVIAFNGVVKIYIICCEASGGAKRGAAAYSCMEALEKML